MSREFVNINSLYQNLYEDLEQLDEIGPVSRSQKLKDRQAKLNQQKSDWQARRSANNTPAPTPVAKPVAKPVAQAAPAPQQKVVSGQGNRQMPVKTGGIKPVSAIQGGLNRLGSLAGKAVGAARNVAGKVGNALSNKGPIQGRQQSQPVVQSRPAPQAQAQARPAQQARPAPQAQAQARPAQQARPASQGGGGSLTQAASNIDAMRSPASGSRQVKPGLIGKLLPNHPGNKGQQARPASQAQAQARPAQQARPASQARNISPADAAAKASPSGVTRTVNVQRDGNKVTRTTNTSADSSTKEGSAAVDAYKKAQAERMALRRANQNNSYELEGDLISDSFDITVDFLISEGHAADNSEAISIMTDPEFIAGFNAELNESSENNK